MAFRICLGGGLQVDQCTAELIFGLNALCHVAGLSRLHHARTCLGHLGEHLGLVAGIALDGFDKVRDEIRTLLQLHVDLRPTVLDAVTQGNQAVISGNGPQHNKNNYDDRDNNANIHRQSLPLAYYFLDYLRIDPTHCTILPISSQMASDSDMQGGTMIATQ